MRSVTIRVAPGIEPGRIELKLGNSWHPNIGVMEIPGSQVAGSWQEITADVDTVTGVHALWLRFQGHGKDLFEIDWLRFRD